MKFCALASGSSGNCIYVGHEDTHILVDAGISGKRIAEGLVSIGVSPGELKAVLITHDHSDHVQGAAVMANKYGIPLYGTRGTLSYIAKHATRGVSEALLRPVKPEDGFKIGDISIMPFTTSHDAIDPINYTLSAGGCKLGMATDLGEYTEHTIEKLKGSDALYLESNHDYNMLMVGPYPYSLKQRVHSALGHLSNDDAAELVLKVQNGNLKNIVLAHLSKENNFPQLAESTMEAAIKQSWEFEELPAVCVAKRSEPSDMIYIG